MKEKERGGRKEWREIEEDSRRYSGSAYENVLDFEGKIGLRCNEDISGRAKQCVFARSPLLKRND